MKITHYKNNFIYGILILVTLLAMTLSGLGCSNQSPNRLQSNTLTATTNPSSKFISPVSSTTATTSAILTSNTTGQELDVHFVNVGEGDAILIDCGTIDVLIDGGEKSANVVNLIKPYVHGDIEAVIATHYHADHIGGQIDVFKDYHVDNTFWNGEVDTTQTYQNWKTAMDTSGAKEQIVKRGDVIQEGTLTFKVLDPVVTNDADPDQDCIVLSLQYG
jgi:beta-lactamase superfamily II metal-dependent hydrolase